VVQRRDTDAFQDRQIVTAALQLLGGRRRSERSQAPRAAADPGERALLFVEANLFLPFTLDDLARHANASLSTLLRSFRRATGSTPYAYVKNRRLDEAKHLLAGGKHAVGEVALLVGYDDFSAFSKAFRRRFQRPPRTYLPV
jgi:transcriptional regulator GlxA family with amidase domain